MAHARPSGKAWDRIQWNTVPAFQRPSLLLFKIIIIIIIIMTLSGQVLKTEGKNNSKFSNVNNEKREAKDTDCR